MQEQPIKKQIFFGNFNIFLLMKTAQMSYGIKNGDYMRYRKYCSRKIEKLRKNMHYKFGNKTKFIRKNIVQDKADDPRILQIMLFNAQKNWAEANQAKFSQNHKPSQQSRIRFYSAKKLRKAAQWARKMKQVCKAKTQSIAQLQSEAYLSFLQGMQFFQCKKWNESQTKLIACRQIIKDLKKTSDTITQRIFLQKMDQIQQTIKYCSFKLSKGQQQMAIDDIIQMKKLGDPTLSTLMQSLTQRRLQSIGLESKSSNQIKFGDQRYPIKSQNILIQKSKIDSQLENLNEIKIKSLNKSLDQKMHQELLMLYSQVVLLLDQAIKMTDKEKQNNNKYTQGQAEILKKVSLLFQQTKLKLFIDRNQTIFKHSFQIYDSQISSRKSTPQTLAKLLSNTITLYTQLIDLEKQKSQISNNLQPQKIQIIDAKIFYIRTVRLSLVGQVYFNNNKIKQAYNLWGQCQRCLKIIYQNQNINDFLLMQNKKLQQIVRIGKIRCIIKNKQTQQKNKQQLNRKIKDININDQPQKLNLTLQKLIKQNIQQIKLQQLSNLPIMQLPGNLQLIPPRPIFLNIFDCQILYPSLEKKSTQSGKSRWWNKFFS